MSCLGMYLTCEVYKHLDNYQMPNKYLEAIKKILLFHVCSYEEAKSSSIQAATFGTL